MTPRTSAAELRASRIPHRDPGSRSRFSPGRRRVPGGRRSPPGSRAPHRSFGRQPIV